MRISVLFLCILAAVGLFNPGGAVAQFPPELLVYLWSAQWITSPDSPQRDQVVLHFHKVIELSQKPEHFVVHVSADNQFMLYVNQQWVGTGPARSDLAHWRYETYDIAPLLRAGKNTLAATVWNFGVLTPLSQISDRTGFVLHGAGDAERMADTNETWEVEEEKGVQLLPTPTSVATKYYVSEPAERIDGAVFDWNWKSESSTGGRWKKAVAIGHASLLGGALQNDNWQLVPDPLPAMLMELAPAGQVVRSTGLDAPVGFRENQFSSPPVRRLRS